MAATRTPEDWDAAWSSTLRSGKKGRLTDNIFDEYPLLATLKKNSQEVEAGGKEFEEKYLYAKNVGTWFDGFDEQNTDSVDGITNGFAPCRYIAVPITISMTEEVENQGAAKVFDLLEAKTMQSTETMRDSVNAALLSAQTGKTTLGFQDWIADDPTTGTVAGINRASESWFRNKYYTTSTDVDSKSGDIYAGMTALNSLWIDCSRGNKTPTDAVTTASVFGTFQTVFESTGYARMEVGDAEANPNVTKFNYRGCRIFYDRDAPTQHLYLWHRKSIRMKIMKGMNFSRTKFKEPHNQFAKVAFVVLGIQLMGVEPRTTGVATTLT